MATASKARTSKGASKATEAAANTAKDTMDTFAYPKVEVPEMFRSYAEESLKQTRDAYGRVKAAAEEATDIMEDGMETGRKTVREAQLKALEMAKANTDATFALFHKLLAADSPTDAVQLQTAFARERFEAFMGYSKELQEMMSKAGEEAGKPAKAMFEKTMSFAKVA